MAMASNVRLAKVDFGSSENEILHKYLHGKVTYLQAKTRGLRERLLPLWVDIYRGTPAVPEATFPWPAASNLVIKIVGTHCDELLARCMAIWATGPVWVAESIADDSGDADDEVKAIEFFLDKMAFEPSELDLYRVEETMWSSTIRYGTGICKIPYQRVIEKRPVSFDVRSEGDTQYYFPKKDGGFEDFVRKDGPYPEPVPLNHWMIDPKFQNLAAADMVIHIIPKDKLAVEDMKRHPEIYDIEKIDRILAAPDRPGPDEFTQKLQSSIKADYDNSTANSEMDCASEWDIYECWHRYNKDGDTYCLVSYCHPFSETWDLGSIYNPYPYNEYAFEDSKLAYDDDTYYGYGFCEMLNMYQEEISKNHNWRINNKNFATTGVGRVNPNSKLSSIITLYPGALIPASQGEVEPLQFGAGAVQYGTEDEQLTLALTKERSGIDPAIGGTGGGIVNAKRGIYSAQGTFSALQQQNNRNSLRTSDMRSSHVRIGRKVSNVYAYFGLGTRLRRYGDSRAQLIEKALDAYKNQRLGLAIKAATASLNRELEKQNDVLIGATLERLYAGDAQIIQLLVTQQVPPPLMEYYVEVLKAKNALMRRMLRNFGRDDVDRLVPVPPMLKEQRNAVINGSGAAAVGAGSPQGAIPGQIPAQGAIPVGPPPTNQVPTGTPIQ